LPTGTSLNSSNGAISGIPTALGSYSFVIRATGSGGTADTGTLTIVVNPPGKRFTSESTSVGLTTMKRFDGTNWVNVTTVKRFDGTSWINITNT